MEVNQAFVMQGDGMHRSAALLPDLIEDGVRLLVYAGNAGESHWHFPNFDIRISFRGVFSFFLNVVCAIMSSPYIYFPSDSIPRYDVQLHGELGSEKGEWCPLGSFPPFWPVHITGLLMIETRLFFLSHVIMTR